VQAATPVVAKLDNAVFIGEFNQDRRDLAAIDPEGFRRVAALSDAFFPDEPAAMVVDRLASDPSGLLVDTETADDFDVSVGDDVHVLLARGTKQQKLLEMHVVGLFERFPGFPLGVHLVANLDQYIEATGLHNADFFLVRATDSGHAGLERTVAGIRAGVGRSDPLDIDTTETTFNKDQSSLTALNVNGLLDLDSVYTLLMSAAAIAIFVFGLMLQRRREYIVLRAQGMHIRQLRVLVLGEAGVVAVSGTIVGLSVGTGMAFFFVHILRPLFILDPDLTFAVARVARLSAVAMAATLVSALVATAILRRLNPSELLREG
jgi:putative ABC transport system permease protein